MLGHANRVGLALQGELDFEVVFRGAQDDADRRRIAGRALLLVQSFLKKNDIAHRPLVDVVTVLRAVLWPALERAGLCQP